MVGNRADPQTPYADDFYFAGCHGHHHMSDFARYELLTADGTRSAGDNCDDQGITSGWGDWYYKQLPGQWIDITGVPEGDYIVRASVNGGLDADQRIFDEGEDRDPNFVEVQIHVPDPRNKVDGTWKN